MNEQNLSLAQAATQFLADLPLEERKKSQQEINKFVRWYGMERPLSGLAAHEDGGFFSQCYAEARASEGLPFLCQKGEAHPD